MEWAQKIDRHHSLKPREALKALSGMITEILVMKQLILKGAQS
jgi:hypothetical protein